MKPVIYKPLITLTGFLGAGKTTLLRRLLQQLHQRERLVDVILNDYENAHIDAATLQAGINELTPLSASCACCDSLAEMVQWCQAATTSRGEGVLIELNGTADPLPLLESFTLLEERLRLWPRWQVCVVDARHWQQRENWNALESIQLETATHWLPSHAGDWSSEAMKRLEASVHAINARARRTDAVALADQFVRAVDARQSPLSFQPFPGSRRFQAPRRSEGHELSHAFSGCQIPVPQQVEKSDVLAFLQELPEHVVRAKMLVELTDGSGDRWLFERTGRHPVKEPLRTPSIKRIPTSAICIGPDLNPHELHELAWKHFGATPVGER